MRKATVVAIGVVVSSCASDSRTQTRAANEPSFCERHDTAENRQLCNKFVPRLLRGAVAPDQMCGNASDRMAWEAVSWGPLAYPCLVDGLHDPNEHVRDLAAAMLLHLGCEGRVLAWCAQRDDEPTLCTTSAPLFEGEPPVEPRRPGVSIAGHVTVDGKTPPPGWLLTIGTTRSGRPAHCGPGGMFAIADAPAGVAYARLTYKAGYRVERQEIRVVALEWQTPDKRYELQKLSFDSGTASLVVSVPESVRASPRPARLELEQIGDTKKMTIVTATLSNRPFLRIDGLREGRYRLDVSLKAKPHWLWTRIFEKEIDVRTSSVAFEIPSDVGPSRSVAH